jgi:hypothetical protein
VFARPGAPDIIPKPSEASPLSGAAVGATNTGADGLSFRISQQTMGKPMRTYTAVLLLLATASAAAADTVTTSNCRSSFYTGYTCQTVTTNIGDAPPPEPAQTTAREREARDRHLAEQDAKWRAFCKPEAYQDQEGITRTRYAHRGCDLGRTQ